MPKKPNPNTKEYWTPVRRKKHSETITIAHSWSEIEPYFDKNKNEWVDGRWTPEFRAKQSKIIKGVWKKRSKAAREQMSNKLKLYHLERRFEALNGRKPPYGWVIELRRLNALVG
jgi:hypothetical protein